MHPSESPVPIFRFCRAGLTRDAAGHKNVDSVNERNWRFLFSSWRSSSRALFYAPPSRSSSDSVVRRNADWILDFTYEPLGTYLLIRVRMFFWTRTISRGNVIINWPVIISRSLFIIDFMFAYLS